MRDFLWLIPTLPFLGALTLITVGTRLSKQVAAIVGTGSIGIAALVTMLIGIDFISSPIPFRQVLWNWMDVGGLNTAFALHLDALSMVFIFVIRHELC